MHDLVEDTSPPSAHVRHVAYSYGMIGFGLNLASNGGEQANGVHLIANDSS